MRLDFADLDEVRCCSQRQSGGLEVSCRLYGGVPFWFGSLCVGGALILIGTFALSRKIWLSFSLTAIGSLGAANATMWTIILPLLAAVLLFLALLRAIRESGAQETGPRASSV